MSKGEETRNRIIEQAAPLFNKFGLSGVSIKDIMAATDLQKGGIYRHFDSKEEIAIAAFDHNYRTLTIHLTEGLSDMPDARTRLLTFLGNFTQVPTLLDGGCALLNTAIEHDDGNPILRERARAALREWRKTLHQILQKGMQTGVFRPALDIESIATLYIAALEGSVMMSRLTDDHQQIQQVIDQLTHHARENVFLENMTGPS